MKTLRSIAILICLVFASIHPLSAQTWTPAPVPNTAWGPITASADGTKLAALAPYQGVNVLWISTNSGASWTSNNIQGVSNAGRIEPPAWSADGSKLAAVILDGNAVLTSTNYGATWTSNSIPTEPWFRIASSADGTKLVTLGGGLSEPGPIFYSADSGQTWLPANAPVTNWVSIAASANGSNWVAAVEIANPSFGGLIYTSTNCGRDWTLLTNAPNGEWLSIACSADGTRFVAVDGQGRTIYTSPDSGQTWISNSLPREYWFYVASSADGRTLAAVAIFNASGDNGDIYTSTNFGVTWVSNNVPAQSWDGIAMSADGGFMAAAGAASFSSQAGNIYLSQTIPTPTLNITPVTNALTLSWLLPSTNLVLQQSLDLTAPNWITLTNTPALNFNNLQDEVILSPTNPAAFYRLTTP